MSRDQEQDNTPLCEIAQLIDYFEQGCKSIDARKVGTEHEKLVFRKDRAGYPLMQFSGAHGIEAILQELAHRYNWEPDFDEGHLLTLTRDGAAISLEPAGQFELSGKPMNTIHETVEEIDTHLRELYEVSGEYAAYLGLGMNPYAAGGELPWMPRTRYQIMRNYMAKQGPLGHWMMQTTCTIQANYDYTSEEDAADIIQTGILISPVIHSIFANSSIALGNASQYQSFRGHIWTQTDNDRCGVPDFMYQDSFGFQDYIEWALDVPMYFIRRDGAYHDCSGLPFRQFMKEGWKGHKATLGDFELHLSTLFPEVRLKRYIEVRCCDGGPREHIFAVPALWKGIFYDETARKEAKEVIWSRGDEHRKLFERSAKQGLHATDIEGRSMRELAIQLVEISERGLDRIAIKDGIAPESSYLAPLKAILTHTPLLSLADNLQQTFQENKGDRGAIIEAYDLLRHYHEEANQSSESLITHCS